MINKIIKKMADKPLSLETKKTIICIFMVTISTINDLGIYACSEQALLRQ